MAGINFFVNWELWQQMTFVLAAAIVVVFFIGLMKLWWMSRYLKKHTILDEEKRARQEEMRKSGLPTGRRIDIPFGVRAIQSGIEVDGIWISQPGTPVEAGSLRETYSISSGSEGGLKGKGRAKIVSGGVLKPTTNVVEIQPTPGQSPLASPAASLLDAATDVESSPQVTPPLRPQPTSRPAQQRLANITSGENLNLDTLNHLEGRNSRAPIETYMPTNSLSSTQSSISSHQRTVVGRNSSSSDEGFTYATPYHTPSTRIDNANLSRPNPVELRDQPEPVSVGSRAAQQPFASDRPIPVRSYNVDTYANTSRRQVNAGFEVLPAGTFGTSNNDGNMGDDSANRSTGRRFSASTKLHKNRDRSSSRGQ
ncbi:hypothetical protein F5X99DRAFT_410838 [Biscogniauxia marginata]|nr:hypothetical protein F5X99DRAFT_410838 [Biscogniauxia marginata]